MKWLTTVFLVIAAVLAGLLLYRNVGPKPLLGGTALDTPIKVPALKLVNANGENTTLAASDGRLRLMFFGFVHCPDVCPATLASLKNTYAGLSPEQQKQVQVQFITVDPVVDTPQLVREYLDKFNPNFTGLTGNPETINEAAKALFVANIPPPPMNMHHGTPGGDTSSDDQVSAAEAGRIHGDQVSIITPAGEFVRVYNNSEAVDGTLQKDLPGLIKQYGGQS